MKKMNAVQMFRNLGFNVYDNVMFVRYERFDKDGSVIYVTFDKDKKSYNVYAIYKDSMEVSEISLEIHRAINKQVSELWGEGK